MEENSASSFNDLLDMILKEPSYVFAIAIIAVLLVLFFAVGIRTNNKKSKLKKYAPEFIFEAFQIAPLGRDAYFKVKNIGHPAYVNFVGIKNNPEVKITNANTTNFEVATNKVYGVFCEIQGNQKIKANFEIELDFKDHLGNQYRQTFAVDQALQKGKRKAKVVKYA